MVKVHRAPKFPILNPGTDWDSKQLHNFAKQLQNNCNYIADEKSRKDHQELLEKHIRHHCAEPDNLRIIITNEVTRRIEGDPEQGVLGIDNRIKEWGKTVFMVTAISQSGVFDTISVMIMNYNMITDIVLASGFRPTRPQLFNIYIRVLSTALMTYCTSELVTDLDKLEPFDFNNAADMTATGDADLGDINSSDIGFGNSIIQRIKTIKIPGLLVESAIQGCINALLTMRIGYVTKSYLLEGPDSMRGLKNKRKVKRQAIKSAFKSMPAVIMDGGISIGGTVAQALVKLFSKETDNDQ